MKTLLNISYKKTYITDTKTATTITVVNIPRTDIYVEQRLVNKPTKAEAMNQTFVNRVYKIPKNDTAIGNKVIVGEYTKLGLFKKSIYYDN